jgi:hypothetical protein
LHFTSVFPYLHLFFVADLSINWSFFNVFFFLWPPPLSQDEKDYRPLTQPRVKAWGLFNDDEGIVAFFVTTRKNFFNSRASVSFVFHS